MLTLLPESLTGTQEGKTAEIRSLPFWWFYKMFLPLNNPEKITCERSLHNGAERICCAFAARHQDLRQRGGQQGCYLSVRRGEILALLGETAAARPP